MTLKKCTSVKPILSDGQDIAYETSFVICSIIIGFLINYWRMFPFYNHCNIRKPYFFLSFQEVKKTTGSNEIKLNMMIGKKSEQLEHIG